MQLTADKINLVYQEDEIGCWLACLAMLTGKTYSEVKKDFPEFDPEDIKTVPTTDRQEKWLKNNGLEPFHYPIEKVDLKSLCFPSLVSLVGRDRLERKMGHAVIYLPDGTVLCPSRGPYNDIKRYAKAYLITVFEPVVVGRSDRMFFSPVEKRWWKFVSPDDIDLEWVKQSNGGAK